ncbi:MAG: hypothetical protein Q9195_002455 [Heterodermia aff. obscurata]
MLPPPKLLSSSPPHKPLTPTQTTHLTIDLSSLTSPNSLSPQNPQKRQKRFNPTIPPPTTRSRKPTQAQPPEPALSDPPSEANNDDDLLQTEAEAETSLPNPNAEDQPQALQILDFHTPNPLIRHRGTIYSCDWTTPLGTDILLAPSSPLAYPGAPGSTTPQPEAREPAPILAFSSVRLMARPMKAVPVDGEAEEEDGEATDGGGVRKKKKNWKGRFAPSMQSGTTASKAIDVDGDEEMASPSQSRAQSPSNDMPAPETSSEPIPSVIFPAPSSPLRPETPPDIQPTSQPADIQPTSQPPDPQPTFQPTDPQPTFQPPDPQPTSQPPDPQPHPPSENPPGSSLLSTLTPHSTRARTAQANFLTKLMDVKKALGETDAVTVYATRPHTGTGPGAQQKLRAREKEEREREREREREGDGELVLIDDDGEEVEDGGRGSEQDQRMMDVGIEERLGGTEIEEGRGSVSPGRKRRRRRARDSSDVLRRYREERVKKPGLRLQPRDRFAAFRSGSETGVSQEVQQPMVDAGTVRDEEVEEAQRGVGEGRRGEGNDDRPVGDDEISEL